MFSAVGRSGATSAFDPRTNRAGGGGGDLLPDDRGGENPKPVAPSLQRDRPDRVDEGRHHVIGAAKVFGRRGELVVPGGHANVGVAIPSRRARRA